MNELEEKYYSNIKEELVQSVIDKKIDTYFTNRNELSHYYNVGKMIMEAQGGESRVNYGNGLIKKFSEKFTKELGKVFSIRTLKYMRKFYLLQKGHPVVAQSISWSHYIILLSIKDINEINYYINQDKTIGIIVCKQNDKYLMEYSSDSRIRITTYELV